MKKICIGFIVFLCLSVMAVGQALADENLEAPDEMLEMDSTADPVPDPVPDPALDEALESEGDITYTAEDPADITISVIEARICEGISDREPLAPGDVFPSDIRSLFCFSRISSPESTEIKHIWYYNDYPVSEVPLAIGASSAWRTFSSKTITDQDTGNWRVEIVTAGGTPIKTLRFIVN